MNSSEYVEKLIADYKAQGNISAVTAWKVALACVGWPYVYGARGSFCTPANRRSYYASKGDEHPTIKSACKNFSGSGSCSGCKWYPEGKKVRFFDCRGFTYWILKQVYNWELMGGGATSQWNTASNWKAKGEIATMPRDTLVCLFVRKGNVMEHTGFGFNDATVECSSGVQYFEKRNKKWTHWGLPVCITDTPSPTPTPTPTPPSPTPTPTPAPGTAIVTGKNVAVRYGPTKSASVIVRAPTGSVLKITPPPDDWECISHNGKTGYMMKQFIRPENGNVVVTGKNVAFRYGPTTSAGIIKRIPTGTVLQTGTPPSDWAHVEYNGKVGYMMKEFIREG